MKKILNKKITVTIGISAYNEEKNIGNLINSILMQKEKTIRIKKIIVISDGSTDKTADVVKKFKNRKIEYILGHARFGKPTRLNQIFSLNTSSVFVIVDADTIFKDIYAIERLVEKFKKNKSVGIVTGNVQPLRARTLIETAVNNYVYSRNKVGEKFNFGKTAYAVHGYLALSKGFLKNFHIPSEILNDDAYCYFSCIEFGKWKHAHAKKSIVYNRSAGTISDYFKQMKRYVDGGNQLHEFFDKDLVTDAIVLPKEVHLKIMLYQLFRNPFAYVLLKIIMYSCIFYCKFKTQRYSIAWPTVDTSKSLI